MIVRQFINSAAIIILRNPNSFVKRRVWEIRYKYLAFAYNFYGLYENDSNSDGVEKKRSKWLSW